MQGITQPTYVNMHELASMAANKAQEMNLPPPPTEFSSNEKVIPPQPTDDRFLTALFLNQAPTEAEKECSTSESSLESSSGYGSQTTFTADDSGQTEGKNEVWFHFWCMVFVCSWSTHPID